MKPNDQALEAFRIAGARAHRDRHTEVGTDHVLAGLLSVSDSIVARALRDLGADMELLRDRLDARLASRPSAGDGSAELPYSRSMQRVFRKVFDGVSRSDASRLLPGLVLAAMMEVSDSGAAELVAASEVDPHSLIELVERLSTEGS